MVTDNALDAGLDYISSKAVYVALCSQAPTTYAQVATYKLADVTITSAKFSKANGDVSGRKLTMAQITGETVDSNGNATHLAITDGASELLAVLALSSSQALVANNPFTINAVDVLEIKDPS